MYSLKDLLANQAVLAQRSAAYDVLRCSRGGSEMSSEQHGLAKTTHPGHVAALHDDLVWKTFFNAPVGCISIVWDQHLKE